MSITFSKLRSPPSYEEGDKVHAYTKKVVARIGGIIDPESKQKIAKEVNIESHTPPTNIITPSITLSRKSEKMVTIQVISPDGVDVLLIETKASLELLRKGLSFHTLMDYPIRISSHL